MNFSQHPRSKTTKSNVALLLQPTLHNFGALATLNRLDGITCGEIRPKSRKSFIALLLPRLFPVSPLLHYSYKKMGGVPPALRSLGVAGVPASDDMDLNQSPTCNSFTSNHLTQFRVGPPRVTHLFSNICRCWGWGWGLSVTSSKMGISPAEIMAMEGLPSKALALEDHWCASFCTILRNIVK
jgi:hypothetical protein